MLFHALWIAGAALVLAAFSTNHWLASQTKTPLRTQLNLPTFQRWLWLGIVLIAIGLAGTSHQWWQTAVYIIIALVSLVNSRS